MTHATSALWFSVSAAIFLPGCPLLDLEVEVQEACIAYQGVEIAGLGGVTDVEQAFVFEDLGELDRLLALDGELDLVRADLVALSGVSSLAFITSANLTIGSGDPASTIPAVDAYACDGDCAVTGAHLTIPAPVGHNILAHLRTGSILVDMRLQGELPAQAWRMDVELCVKGALHHAIE